MSDQMSEDPWDWMQPHDAVRMGSVIFDREEQARWSRAVMLGGLPYMWGKKATAVRRLMFDRLSLKEGDRVFVIGESIESCGFDAEIRKAIGSGGAIDVFDITEQARDAYISGARGRAGALATWAWDYSRAFADRTFDAVAVLQGVQHTDDWQETGMDLVRVAKPGAVIMLGEITFSPEMLMKAGLDLHLEYWVEKLFARIGWMASDFPYYSAAALKEAFAGLLTEAQSLEWKGLELFWGQKQHA